MFDYYMYMHLVYKQRDNDLMSTLWSSGTSKKHDFKKHKIACTSLYNANPKMNFCM